MTVVQKAQVVSAAIAPTWAAVSRMGAVEDWHPNVARSLVLTTHDTGMGASRRVEFHDGNSALETVIEQSDLDFTSMELTEVPLLDKAVVTIRTEKRSADTTEVTFSIDYRVKFGPIGWLINAVMMKRVFGKVFGVALAGLAYHLETGKLVTDSLPTRTVE